MFSSLSGGLPASNGTGNGRTLQSNTVAQYRIAKYFVPEVEINSTRYFGGARDGKTQTFLTPGIVMGKIAIRPAEAKSRMGIVAGAAFQTALTSYHTYNHAVVVSLRLAF